MPVCSPHTRDSAKSAVRARRPEPWAAVANCSGHRLKTPLTSSNRPAAPAKDPIASRPVSVPYAPAPVPPQYRADRNALGTARFSWQFLGLLVCPVLWGRKCWKTWDRHGARPVRPDCMGRYDRRPWRLGPNVGSILQHRQQDSPPCAKLSGHNGRL